MRLQMRIMHIGLSSHFTEGMTYQDNQLAKQNALDGHTVLYVSDTYRYEEGRLTDVGLQREPLDDGVQLIRLPYERIINRTVSEKIRKVAGLYDVIDEFRPDVIMSHSLCYYSVRDVVRYVREHPHVTLYADTHANFKNSATSIFSRCILHGLIYRKWISEALPYVKKYLYVGSGEKDFSASLYGIDESKMEFFPLGGFIPSDGDYLRAREERRRELAVGDDELLLVHSGKITAEKKTETLLHAFREVESLNARLVIIGTLSDECKEEIERLVKSDARVEFLGWKSGDELREYLCAADLYCQPGSFSATLQNAITCRCPLLSYPHDGYRAFDFGNFFWASDRGEIADCLRLLQHDPSVLVKMSQASIKCSETYLDYRKLAARLYE